MKVVLLIIIGLGFAVGFLLGQYNVLNLPGVVKPDTPTIYVKMDRQVYVDRVLESPRTVEVIPVAGKGVNPPLSSEVLYPERFASAEIARKWVLSHKLPVVLIADEQGVISSQSVNNPKYDCDDYADDFEKLALAAGISLWQAPVTNGTIWGVQVTENIRGNHVGLWTKIDGVYYYIEPGPAKDEWRFIKIMSAD